MIDKDFKNSMANDDDNNNGNGSGSGQLILDSRTNHCGILDSRSNTSKFPTVLAITTI